METITNLLNIQDLGTKDSRKRGLTMIPKMDETEFANASLDGLKLEKLIEGKEKFNKYEPISSEVALKYGFLPIQIVCRSQGLFTFPTTELIDWLRNEIDDDPNYYPDAIEINCGSGWIGRHLEIPFTDNKAAEKDPNVKFVYQNSMQFTPSYPDDVEELDAIEAVKKYNPEYIISSYPIERYKIPGTNRYYGFDINWCISHCHKFIMIGNLNIHSKYKCMERKHKELSFPWLITRGDINSARIFVFENKQWK